MGKLAVDAWRRGKFQHKDTQPCAYCRKPLTCAESTVDHRTPKSRGGLESPVQLLHLLQAVQCPQEEHDGRRVPSRTSHREVAEGESHRSRAYGAVDVNRIEPQHCARRRTR